MKRDNYFNSIGTLYGDILNGVKKELIKEEKKQPPNAFNSKLPIEKSKPIDGYNQALNDEKDCNEDEDNEEFLKPKTKQSKASVTLANKAKKEKNPKKKKKLERKSFEHGFYSEGEEETEKNYTESINRVMKQSAFDKLVKKVLKENFGQDDTQELDALGLDDATPDTELDDEFGDDLGDETEGEGDTVTFTLDRATAQALVDVLQGALGGDVEDDLGDEGDDLNLDDDFGGDDEFGDEGDDLEFGEEDNEEWGTKPAPDKKAAFQGKNNKVGGKANPKSSGKASSDVTDEQGTKDGAPSFTHLQGKDNKVKSQVNAGDFFK